MTTLISIIISLLISLGIITNESDLNNLSDEQQRQIEIIIEDFDDL